MQIKWPEFGRVESGLCCGRQSLSGRAVQDSEQQRGQDCVRGFLSCSVGRSLGWPEWLLEPWRDGCFLLFHANLLGSFCMCLKICWTYPHSHIPPQSRFSLTLQQKPLFPSSHFLPWEGHCHSLNSLRQKSFPFLLLVISR